MRPRRRAAALALPLVMVALTPSRAAADKPAPSAPAAPEATPAPSHDEGERAPTTGQGPTVASAKSGVEWDPRWPKFSTGEAIATTAFIGVAFASLVIPPSKTRWNSVNSFDAGARDALRIGSLTGRNFARDTSDVLLALVVNQLAIDSLIVAWWRNDRSEVAAQMMLIDLEAFALTGAVNAVVAGLASRERPYVANCTGPENRQPEDCTSSKRYRSFFSGHTSGTFTAAALTCAHHANLPLYGGGAPDALACAAAMAAAATVGTMRVMADQHFVTDVATGALVGTAAGLGVPYLLHYMHDERGEAGRRDDGASGRGAAERERRKRARPSARLVPAGLGVALVGSFQ